MHEERQKIISAFELGFEGVAIPIWYGNIRIEFRDEDCTGLLAQLFSLLKYARHDANTFTEGPAYQFFAGLYDLADQNPHLIREQSGEGILLQKKIAQVPDQIAVLTADMDQKCKLIYSKGRQFGETVCKLTSLTSSDMKSLPAYCPSKNILNILNDIYKYDQCLREKYNDKIMDVRDKMDLFQLVVKINGTVREILRSKPEAILTPDVDVTDPCAVSESKISKNLFQNKGDYWLCSYDNKVVLVNNNEGMRYVANLLDRKGKTHTWLELDILCGNNLPVSKIDDEKDDYDNDEQSEVGTAPQKKADTKAIRESFQEFKRLKNDCACHQPGSYEYDECQREIEKYEKYLSQTIRYGGGIQTFKDDTKRSKGRISTNIKRAINAIEKIHHTLGKHLRKNIDRKSFCYDPGTKIEWDVRLPK